MLRFTLTRLLSLCLSLAVASVVIFAAIEVLPGDPASIMLGVNAQPDTLAALRAELGLDQPMAARYLDWIGGCCAAISASPTPTGRRWWR